MKSRLSKAEKLKSFYNLRLANLIQMIIIKVDSKILKVGLFWYNNKFIDLKIYLMKCIKLALKSQGRAHRKDKKLEYLVMIIKVIKNLKVKINFKENRIHARS